MKRVVKTTFLSSISISLRVVNLRAKTKNLEEGRKCSKIGSIIEERFCQTKFLHLTNNFTSDQSLGMIQKQGNCSPSLNKRVFLNFIVTGDGK